MVIHLEVVTESGGYGLRGWIESDLGGKHKHIIINSGRVRDGVPDRITLQSGVMGRASTSTGVFTSTTPGSICRACDYEHHMEYNSFERK